MFLLTQVKQLVTITVGEVREDTWNSNSLHAPSNNI